MYPILNVGPAAVQLPGLILLVGFWLSLNLTGRQARRAGLSEDVVFNGGMIALLTGLIGARLGYVALHWSVYQDDLAGILALNAGALSTPTGLLVGVGAAAWYLRQRAILSVALLDVLAPGLALMLAFVSLANLSAGSAYGAVTDLPWAIELWGARRHPTQLYGLAAALGTLGVWWWARDRKPYDGFLFLLSLLIYSAARLFLHAFRADPWLLPGGYRAVQVISLGVVLLSLELMRRRTLQTLTS